MASPEKVIYTGIATSTGGRSGSARSSDGALDLTLSTPKELGGNGGTGTNPEQLFAAAYSACFIGAMQVVGAQRKTPLPENTSVTAEVGIGRIKKGFGIKVTLNISIPGWDRAETEAIAQAAHLVCPYSNATRNNIEVDLNVA